MQPVNIRNMKNRIILMLHGVGAKEIAWHRHGDMLLNDCLSMKQMLQIRPYRVLIIRKQWQVILSIKILMEMVRLQKRIWFPLDTRLLLKSYMALVFLPVTKVLISHASSKARHVLHSGLIRKTQLLLLATKEPY